MKMWGGEWTRIRATRGLIREDMIFVLCAVCVRVLLYGRVHRRRSSRDRMWKIVSWIFIHTIRSSILIKYFEYGIELCNNQQTVWECMVHSMTMQRTTFINIVSLRVCVCLCAQCTVTMQWRYEWMQIHLFFRVFFCWRCGNAFGCLWAQQQPFRFQISSMWAARPTNHIVYTHPGLARK